MGILQTILNGAGLAYDIYKDQHLTGAQREANAFTAQQAQNAMNFESQQAQNQMDFQERMANTQYQRAVSDMQAAGLNPALAYQNGGAVAPSGASGSGSAGTSVDPGRGASMSDVVMSLKLEKELELMDAQISKTKSEAELTGANTEYRRKEINVFDKMTQAEYDNMVSDLDTKEVQRNLAKANISETEARTALEIQQKTLAVIDTKYQDELKQLEVKKRIREIANTAMSTKKMRAELGKIDAEINELYQRAILEACEAGNLDAATENLLIQNGILRVDKEKAEYEVRFKGVSFWTKTIGNTLGAISSAAGAFGAAGVGARAFGMLPRATMPSIGFPTN